jgi:hypothetical protein
MITPDQEQQGDQRSVRGAHRANHHHSPLPSNHLQRHLIFAAAILVIGVVAGVMGASTTLLPRAIEHMTYGYTAGHHRARDHADNRLGTTAFGASFWLGRDSRNAAVSWARR